jgi:hypothetical protein
MPFGEETNVRGPDGRYAERDILNQVAPDVASLALADDA